MSFPLSPINGQTAVLNGITYSYSSASALWSRVAAVVPNTHKSTSSANSPASPNIGDIWYNTVTDDVYRYTSDGVSSYWLDITGASTTLTTGAASALVVSQPTYAVSFNGTSQYLSVPYNTVFQFTTVNFTIEFWVNFTSVASGQNILNAYTTGGTNLNYAIYTNVTGRLDYLISADGSTWNIANAAIGNISVGQWYHVALVRNGSVFTPYLNGAAGTPATSAAAIFTNTSPVYIGGAVNGSGTLSQIFNGSISNLRIVRGTAVYTAAFAVPSTPLTAITNTVLLTCQSVPVSDASTTTNTVTNVAGASLSIYAAPAVSYASQTLYYRLNTDLVGANSTAVQKMLGVGVTLSSNTVYQFDAMFALVKSAGTTSYTFNLSFGGTATLNNIAYQLSGQYNGTGFDQITTAIANLQLNFVSTAANFALITSASATGFLMLPIKGTVSVNAGGTFIPQYSLSAAPGGAYTTAAGSYITFTPIGSAGANSSLGTWA